MALIGKLGGDVENAFPRCCVRTNENVSLPFVVIADVTFTKRVFRQRHVGVSGRYSVISVVSQLLPVLPRKRTSSGPIAMSQTCQERKIASGYARAGLLPGLCGASDAARGRTSHRVTLMSYCSSRLEVQPWREHLKLRLSDLLGREYDDAGKFDGDEIAKLYCVPTVTVRGDGSSIDCLQSREEVARFFQGVSTFQRLRASLVEPSRPCRLSISAVAAPWLP